MSIGQYEFVQIKGEADVEDEIFDLRKVKFEPCESEIFVESGEYDGGSTDYRGATLKYEDQKDKKYGENEMVTEYGHHTKLSPNECKAEPLSEDDIDSRYEDVRTDIVEMKAEKCELSGSSFEDMSQDVKGSFLCYTTESTVQLLKVEEGSATENGNINKQVSFAEFQRDSVFSMKNYRKRPLTSTLMEDDNILVNHQMIYIAEERLDCKLSPRTFSHWSHSKARDRIHTFHCKICFKVFTQSSQLKVHERTHSGKKPYECKTCSRAFIRSDYLRVHERIHTGEKPYDCNICSKTFARSSNLTRHKRTHSGEKPFHCKVCLWAFSQSSHLREHERIHTGEKPFSCKYCFKAFTRSSHLKDHERAHTGDTPFHCKVCPKAFVILSKLKRHEKIHIEKK